MELSERFTKAFKLAFEMHGIQARKQDAGADPETAIPYMGHILGVTSIVIDDGGSEDEVIAALLHDGPEDSGGESTLNEIGEQFGDEVKAIVKALSDSFDLPKPEWKPRKEKYLARLRELPDNERRRKILRVSLADKLHNARSILLDRATEGESVWGRFTGSKDESLWYYRTLADIYEAHLDGTPLVVEYRKVIDQLAT